MQPGHNAFVDVLQARTVLIWPLLCMFKMGIWCFLSLQHLSVIMKETVQWWTSC